MGPDDFYKRRHYGTPQSIILMMGNFIVFAVASSIFASEKTISSFFWVVMGILAVYNVINIRKDREEYTRIRIIAYIISVLLMVGMFILFRLKA